VDDSDSLWILSIITNFSKLKQGDVRSEYSHLGIVKLLFNETRVKVVVCTCVLVKLSDYVVKCLFRDQIVVNQEELYLVETAHENPRGRH